MKIECLRAHVTSGGKVYPVYVGFAPAEDIAKVAVAPAFARTTPHQQIADNLTTKPVRDWQRPINAERVAGIANTFNDTGGLMPNPVLLAKNAFSSGITITAKSVDGMPYQSGTFLIDVPETTVAPADRPLWILDGQHRIAGLSSSAQRRDPVPLVLLLDDGSGSYTSPLLASLFAQVTTAAQKLDDLHNEWLTYAFELGRYNPLRDGHESASKAFASVVELCKTAQWSSGQTNPFFNQVQFNEHRQVGPTMGGFAFKCTTLSDLLAKNYYARPAQYAHLAPSALAEEIARAYIALHTTIQGHHNSVFFGQGGKQQAIVQEAWLIGILTRLLMNGTTANYPALFQALNFQGTNWDFSWIRTLNGTANTASKKIAREVFEDALNSGKLPSNSSNLADHLKGNGASVDIVSSRLSPKGRPVKSGKITYTALRGSTGSHATATNPHVKIGGKTSNVGEVQVLDTHVVGKQQRYRDLERRGLVLQSPLSSPLDIVIVMQHYGDLSSQAEVQLNW
ncbi:hypothetical protein [Nocardioides houyundeii]|uniref:hypothetical protein n=1 Tax=Nocardioides houyundeii TaxID=2045452 RepID=UPI0013B44BE7|nr:hypothetical protein [Nocardioides houyundeii]